MNQIQSGKTILVRLAFVSITGFLGVNALKEFTRLNINQTFQSGISGFQAVSIASTVIWVSIFLVTLLSLGLFRINQIALKENTFKHNSFWLIILILPGLVKWFILPPDSLLLGYWSGLFLITLSAVIVILIQAKKDEGSVELAFRLAANLLVAGAAYSIFSRLAVVTDYPFQLFWSEGNRFFDYSTLFGSFRYLVPTGEKIYAFITPGRAFPWAFPFLFPNLDIASFRLWDQLVWVLPAFSLGWIAIWSQNQTCLNKWQIWVFILWTFLILDSGPIYPPLLIAAILALLSTRLKLLPAIFIVLLSSLYAHFSRWTWSFAPSIWAALLALLKIDKPSFSKDFRKELTRPAALGLTGLVGGLLLPILLGSETTNFLTNPLPFVARQPLLWDRLWPNTTFPPGIVLAIVWVCLPLIVLLATLAAKKVWRMNGMQVAAVLIILIAFLAVGLTASVKIGGGSNLHNLDMALVTLVFLAAAASTRIENSVRKNPLMAILIFLASVAPVTYTARSVDRLSLPDDQLTQEVLDIVRTRVNRAVEEGEVLFIDHRQLLTFGEIQDIPLVDEYEKKLLMDMAMAENNLHFRDFYRDLAVKRFALIVNEPAFLGLKGEENAFSQENNAYVEWVTLPLLCNYEPIFTSKETGIELLAPRGFPPVVDSRCQPYLKSAFD